MQYMQSFEESIGSNETRVLEALWFEKYDIPASQKFVESQQHNVVYASFAYVALTFIGREWMKSRKPYDLKGVLIIWNWILAIFSTVGFFRTAPTLISLLAQPNGMYRSVCTFDYTYEPELFWAYMYTISKIFEFIDTVFIILRKAPLLFLHWFHHFTMAIFMVYLYPISDPIGRWGGVLNLGIHSVMYSYYALKMSGFKIPKRMSSILTSMQMGQFVITLYANFYALYMLATGQSCILSNTMIAIQLFGSITYLSLFANYYVQTYVKRKPKSA